MIWITRIGSTQPRVVCYWNISEVKEGKLKYTMKERTKKTSQTMQLNTQIKQGKLNRKKRYKNTKNKYIKEVKIMKKKQINNNMQLLSNSKVKFVSVSQLLALALWSLFGSDSSPFIAPGLIVSLWGGKKKTHVDFKLAQPILLVFLAAAGWGELGFTFLPSYGFVRMGASFGRKSSQWPSLQPSSSIHLQTHSAPGWDLQSTSCAVLEVY